MLLQEACSASSGSPYANLQQEDSDQGEDVIRDHIEDPQTTEDDLFLLLLVRH
jgi:hypothetical protein